MRTDLKNIHERYNSKMRWETARKKESKFSDLTGHSHPRTNHNRGTEICKVNWKSQPELTTADIDRVVPSKLPSSDDCNGKISTVTLADMADIDCGKYKIAMGAESDRTKISKGTDTRRNGTAVVTENEVNVIVPDKGRQDQIKIANGVSIAQSEKDFSKRQEKQSDLSDADSNDSENECTEPQEEETRKPVLNINIAPDSVSDVESQLKNLVITQSGGDIADLCERSPMGNERLRVRSDPPYPHISSKLRCNGGGIVAESLAPADCLYSVSPSVIPHFNINDLPEPNNNVLLQSAPEFPFGEESSLPEPNNNFLLPSSQGSPYGEESCPLPDVEQEHLDIWLNGDSSNVDKVNTQNTEGDNQFRHPEVRDDLSCLNSPNIHPEQNELCLDAAWPIPTSSSLPYRQAESIASLSSPSSGSRYSSECSPSSSPVPSLADSVTGKSDSDIENELWKIESNLQKGYGSLTDVQSYSAHCVNDRGLNNMVSSGVICGQPYYPLASHLSVNFQPSEPAIRFQPAQPAQCNITMQSVQPANPAVSVQSATSIQLAEPARGLQPALPGNYLQRGNCLQPTQPSNCSKLAQSVKCLQHTQRAPPAISVQPGLQNIQLPPPRNTQTVIIQRNVQPFIYVPPQQPNIQRGPVIPETVAASARERLLAEVDKKVKDRVVMTLAKLTDDQLSKGDEHGDTQLMILIVNEHEHKLEQIYVMVSMLKNIPGGLAVRNAQNQSALSLACVFLHHMPFVARFIAEVMLETGLPLNEVYEDGNTLLHILCAKGDSHVDVLAELLSMKDQNGAPCFDINQHNYREGTPLHVAVKMHSRKVDCSRTIAFLLSQGTDVLAQERSGGMTALHMAIKESCDPLLVQLLLQAAERRNINLEIQKIIHRR